MLRTQSLVTGVGTPALALCLALNSVLVFGDVWDDYQSTRWHGESGDWFDPNNWDNGVPHLRNIPTINQGVAHFGTDVFAAYVDVGAGERDDVGNGEIIGTANFTAYGWMAIGTARSPRADGSSSGTGYMESTGDLRVLPLTIDLATDIGDIRHGSLNVGKVIGSGTNRSFEGHGTLKLTNGSIVANDFDIGVSVISRTGSTGNATGRVDLVGGDISLERFDSEFQEWVPGMLRVGTTSGTGSNPAYAANGTLNLTDGSILANHISVGRSIGSDSMTGTAVGQLTIVNGDIEISDIPEWYWDGSLMVGDAGGTGTFRGNATGELTIHQGSISAPIIVVGRTTRFSSAQGRADGKLTVIGGNVAMDSFELGASYNGGPVTGRFEHYGGITSGNSFTQGPGGSIVLGIGGPTVGDEYSQISVTDALLNGSIEARFVDGYQPKRGDVYELVVAENISGNYFLSVTGIDLASYPDLMVEKTDTHIRIVYPVPEPGTLLLSALACCVVIGCRGRSSSR